MTTVFDGAPFTAAEVSNAELDPTAGGPCFRVTFERTDNGQTMRVELSLTPNVIEGLADIAAVKLEYWKREQNPCSDCNGRGEVLVEGETPPTDTSFDANWTICKLCGGHGYVLENEENLAQFQNEGSD